MHAAQQVVKGCCQRVAAKRQRRQGCTFTLCRCSTAPSLKSCSTKWPSITPEASSRCVGWMSTSCRPMHTRTSLSVSSAATKHHNHAQGARHALAMGWSSSCTVCRSTFSMLAALAAREPPQAAVWMETVRRGGPHAMRRHARVAAGKPWLSLTSSSNFADNYILTVQARARCCHGCRYLPPPCRRAATQAHASSPCFSSHSALAAMLSLVRAAYPGSSCLSCTHTWDGRQQRQEAGWVPCASQLLQGPHGDT